MKEFDVEYDEMVGEELDNQFGNGNLRNNKRPEFKKTKYMTLAPGNNFYRIMPEMFGGIEKGLWTVYYVRHWGYRKANGSQQPFCCVKKYDPRSRVVTKECQFCKNYDYHEQLVETLEKEIQFLQKDLAQAQDSGTDDEVDGLETSISAKEGELAEVKRKLVSPERKFWVNAMNKQGEFGLLALPKTVYEQLSGKRNKDGTRTPGLMKTLEENEGVQALGINEGVWFNIVRTGTDQYSTEYLVSVEEEYSDVGGRKVKQTKLAPLSAEQKARALKECVDLTTVFDHLILSDEEMMAIVNGSPAAVSAISSAPKQVTEKKPSLDENFGSSAGKAPVSVKRKKTDEEILAELKGIA